MNEFKLKVLILVTLFSIFTVLPVIKQLSQWDYKPRHVTAEEARIAFDEALGEFRKKYDSNYNPNSSLHVFEKIKPVDLSMSFEEKLEIVEGVDYPLGNDGRPVILEDELKSHIVMKIREGWKRYGFNTFVSDIIPIDRTLQDVRYPWCLKQNYSNSLPQVSVVITFYKESWSALMRTVYSVLTRTPDYLLKQIIMFDDFSNATLPKTYEEYIGKLSKVNWVKASNRLGLIKARIQALDHVTAPVVVYLDSHCECTDGWLEPLLDRISHDPTRVVSPMIDRIHARTFEYIPQDEYDLKIGGFNWDLNFIWRPLPRHLIKKRKRINPAEPIETPTIPGGIFAIDVNFFQKLGLYDPGFEVWGAENLELSFKAWMCGGSMEIVPCSHIGHIFKKGIPYEGVEEAVTKNNIRLAEVWLDEYKKFYFERIGTRKVDSGDVSARLELRNKLRCKSFKWYLDKVYRGMELPDKYVASGQITSVIYDNMCLDGYLFYVNETVSLKRCHRAGGNQYWIYTRNGELKRNDKCLDSVSDIVSLYICKGRVLSQMWLYDKKTNYIRNMSNQKCLKVLRTQEGASKLVLENCLNSLAQKWILENYNEEKMSPELKIYAQKEISLIELETKTEILDELQVLK